MKQAITKTLTFYSGLTLSVAAALAIFWYARFFEKNVLMQNLERQALSVEAIINQSLNSTGKAVKRMSNRLSKIDSVNEVKWRQDAINYVKDIPALIAVSILTKHGVVKWIEPHEQNNVAVGLNLMNDPIRSKAILSATESDTYVFSSPVEFVQGGYGLLLISAMKSEGDINGYVSSLISFQSLKDDVFLRLNGLTDFSIGLKDESENTLFNIGEFENGRRFYEVQKNITFGGNNQFILSVSPNEAMLNKHLGVRSTWVLFFNIFLIAVGVAFYYSNMRLKRYALKKREFSDRINKLLKEELRLREALDKHAIVSVADIDGNITYCNDKFCEISGYSRDEIMGKNHNLVKSDYHDRDFYREIYKSISKYGAWRGEIKNRKKNGESYWVDASIHKLTNEKNEFDGFISVRTDITLQKESELKNKKIAQAKDNFISLISHELRTPLNGVIGYSSLFETTNLNRSQLEYLASIKTCSQMLLSQLDQITSLSKLIEPDLNAKTVLNEAVNKVISELEFDISNKGLNIVIQGNDEIEVHCSKEILHVILNNVISNSVKYNRDNGSIEIDYFIVGSNVAISIKDTGFGIDEKSLGTIFNKFDRGRHYNSNIPGTGIGLSLVKQYVDMHGGEITFESDGKSFTICKIVLPMFKARE